jgi:hypothetical protein
MTITAAYTNNRTVPIQPCADWVSGTHAVETLESERGRLGRVPSRRMATHSTTAAEGSEAPRFELSDAQGVAVSVDELLARGPVVLVFLRGFA